MNILYPNPLEFDARSTVQDTLEACQAYDVKPPQLNSVLFEQLLGETNISREVQESLVRGWREGFDLGSELPRDDHMAKAPNLNKAQEDVLRKNLETEVQKGRMIGPLTKPLADNKWFENHWVSPYFVIPKTTPPGMEQKWRLIHHLSFHNKGKQSSVNGHIDIQKFPSKFPSPLTGAHLIFCLSPPGSALLGRDVKDYYRNFILNPYT